MTFNLVGSTVPLVCGHRGAAAVAPENTLESFAAAIQLGASWVEFDVRPAGDGTFIVHHDPVTTAGQHIASTDPADFDDSIPTFGQVVGRCAGMGLDIELKTDDVGISDNEYVELVGAEIVRHCRHRQGEIVVTSFDAEVLAAFHRKHPDIATGLLFAERATDWAVSTAVATGHSAIAPWFQLVDQRLVQSAHDAGLAVMTWTVNDPTDIARMADDGVDMIIGDDPSVINGALSSHGSGD